MHIERWVFTDAELKSPRNCKSDDHFFAHLIERSGDSHEIVMCRNGKSTSLFLDGVRGVPDDLRELAEKEETLYTTDCCMEADNWRDVVVCDENGCFIQWAVVVGLKIYNKAIVGIPETDTIEQSFIDIESALRYALALWEGNPGGMNGVGECHNREIIIHPSA